MLDDDRIDQYVCKKCGVQHVPSPMIVDAMHSLKREWGVTLHELLASVPCEDFRHRRGSEIMELLRESAEDQARDQGLD
jgi:hypothetical protein